MRFRRKREAPSNDGIARMRIRLSNDVPPELQPARMCAEIHYSHGDGGPERRLITLNADQLEQFGADCIRYADALNRPHKYIIEGA